MTCNEAIHSIFYGYVGPHLCIYLVVYINDIVIMSNDQDGISKLKICQHFQRMDLGKLSIPKALKTTQSKSGIVISQYKYAPNILEERKKTNCRPMDTPMDPNAKLLPRVGKPCNDPSWKVQAVG